MQPVLTLIYNIMKTIINVFSGLILLTGLFFLGGCDKIESLTDVKFNASMDANIGVVIPANTDKAVPAGGYEFSESAVVDPREDPDIDKYFDKLKGFEVQEVTGTIGKVLGGPVAIDGATLTISTDNQSVTWNIRHLQLQEGETVTFGNDNGEWDKVNKILNEKKKFTVTLAGTSDKNGISFTVKITIKVKVTANPLN